MTFNHVGLPKPLPCLTDKMVSGRRFYTTPDGISYPSITTLLGHEEKQAIKDWRTMLGPKKAKQETDRCAARGTAVHEMVEKYLNNTEIVQADYKNEHFLKFKQIVPYLNNIDKIHTQESALYSDELRIAGRVDCIGEYNGCLSIIDFKTSTNAKTVQMIGDYYIQTTAYALMYYEMTGVMIEDIVIIMSVERGLPLVFRQKITPYIKPLLRKIETFYKDYKA